MAFVEDLLYYRKRFRCYRTGTKLKVKTIHFRSFQTLLEGINGRFIVEKRK